MSIDFVIKPCKADYNIFLISNFPRVCIIRGVDNCTFSQLLQSYFKATNQFKSREHEGTERCTDDVGQDVSIPLKLFLVSGSLFSETSA